MNKSLIIAVALIAAGAGVYFYSQGKDAGDMMESATGAIEGATEAASGAVEGATEAVSGAVEGAVEGATEAASGAVEGATEAASGAAEAVSGAVEGAAEAASGAVEGATEAVEGAVEGAAETATESAEGAPEAASSEAETSMTDTLLSEDGFDPAKVSEMIDGSDLDPLKKTMLKTAVEKAGDNPDMIKAVIEQIKGAMGM